MKNLPPLPLKDGALLIDNSFIERLTSCPRSLQYDRLMQRRPSIDAPALNFGSAIHAALEYRYKHCKNDTPTILDEQDINQNVIIPYFAANPQPEGDWRTADWAFEVLKHYNQRYQVEPFHLLTDEKGDVMVEITFICDLFTYDFNPADVPGRLSGVIPIKYIGRIDLSVLWDNQDFIGDHKTAGQLGDQYFSGQKVSSQYEGYCWAYREITKREPAGFFINAIRTKEAPAKPKNGWDAWWEEGLVRHKEYLRPGQLDEWKANTIAHIREFFWHYENDFMPQRKKSCTMFGKCPWYDVCYLPEHQRVQELNSDKFTTNDWSPLKQ